MENLPIYLLIAYHFLFFYWAYTKPYTLATSELLSTFFPSWLHGGKNESYYWYSPSSHPVLSSHYPFSNLLSNITGSFKINNRFKGFVYFLCLHYCFASCIWFAFLQTFFNPLVALFGAITFTYQTYHLKQQPCIVYTLTWFPVLL